ncbi:MAG: hypothetical protein PHT81_04195 [Endomicrobiaceae bacterium]|nr:hypothetical protein [Endomicrobiaceae bacterium]
MKKIIYFLIAFLLIIMSSCILFEFFLQTIPLVYRNFPSSNDKVYVYVLGESSAWGHPYQGKISFSKIIRCSLNNHIGNKEIELIVLAGPGEQLIHQYFKYFIYKYTHPLKKGIVLMYMGTNDWEDEGTKNPLKQIYIKFKFAGLLNSYFKIMYDFAYEYERIILLAKSFGDDIYMSTIVGNYAGLIPNSITSLLSDKELNDEINKVDNLIFNKEYESAFKKCNVLLGKHEDKSQIWYRIGKIYEGQNKVKEANEAYLNAVEYDRDARPTRHQNKIIKDLSKKYNIPLLDIFDSLFKLNEIIGYNYFIDKIHPNIKFNIMIAKGFISLLMKKYNLSLKEDLSEKTVITSLGFSKNDLFILYRDALGEIIAFSYRTDDSSIDDSYILDRYNLEVIKQYIYEMKKINGVIKIKNLSSNLNDKNRVTLLFSDILFEYIQGNKVKTLKMIKDNDLVKYFNKVEMHCWNIFFKKWLKQLIKEDKNNLQKSIK